MPHPVLHVKHEALRSLLPSEFDYVSMTEEDFDTIDSDEAEATENAYQRGFSSRKRKKCFG